MLLMARGNQMANKSRTAVSQVPLPFDMVPIPAGPFIMGTENGDERPQHVVTLPAYYIGRYPVTRLQFDAYRKNKRLRLDLSRPSSGIETGPQYPEVFVTWKQAIAYCRWLERVYLLPFRLPTEAEWEKAARGTDGRAFPWGNGLEPTVGNFDNKVGYITPVDRYQEGASPYGVVDMAGNALEWTSSLYRPYPYQTEDGREDLVVDGDRVLRGGCYNRSSMLARCASRIHASPDASHDYFGFRVALSPRSILIVVENRDNPNDVSVERRHLEETDSVDERAETRLQFRNIEPPESPQEPNITQQDLATKLGELQRRYETYTKRINALDTDIGRAMHSVERQVLGEQRDDLAAERDQIKLQMETLEAQFRH
jgi:formylglycine-generating enzyme required for sulfatase activity